MNDSFSYQPLTPIAFLERSARVSPEHPAVVDGERRFTYRELHERSRRLAGALAALGVDPDDRVAVLAPNSHMLLEAHNGVPLGGGVLVALNVRLKPEELAYILGHSEAKVLLYDSALGDTAQEAAKLAPAAPRLVQAGGGDDEYEGLLSSSEPLALPVTDERGLLSINYTSGTTGRPKGVMYHHRGAYLQSLAMAFHTGLGPRDAYLWTLPMFHCNGWCFTWGASAAGSTHVCLRKIDAEQIWRLIREEGVTHFSAAPTVLNMLASHPAAADGAPHAISAQTGGAPPSPTLLERMATLNIDVTHLYGLTETFGPSVVCQWHPEWDSEPPERQARLKARQGVGNVIGQPVRVVTDKGADVPADAETIGQIALRGNNVMLGYYRDPDETRAATPDGWFRTGDLGVMHPDGYVELRDRLKDVIISGGENIASVEVEQVLEAHADVVEAAVVGLSDPKWGEVPVAFVTLRPDTAPSPDDLIAHVRTHIARFKAPKKVFFGELPKTSTGKVEKYVLRERARQDEGG